MIALRSPQNILNIKHVDNLNHSVLSLWQSEVFASLWSQTVIGKRELYWYTYTWKVLDHIILFILCYCIIFVICKLFLLKYVFISICYCSSRRNFNLRIIHSTWCVLKKAIKVSVICDLLQWTIYELNLSSNILPACQPLLTQYATSNRTIFHSTLFMVLHNEIRSKTMRRYIVRMTNVHPQ